MNEAFVYEWTDNYNGMFYIGFHKGTEDDGYTGSGTLFTKAYNNNPHHFTREILATGTCLEMWKFEEQIQSKVNAAKNPRYYNMRNGGSGYTHTAEAKAKMGTNSKSLTGRKLSKEHKENISKSGVGRIWSEESRLKASKAKKGIPKSEAHKQKIRESILAKYKLTER